jgi:hypothetical protein
VSAIIGNEAAIFVVLIAFLARIQLAPPQNETLAPVRKLYRG